jgi:2-oxoacid:acceptor oxidoreductase gamma subunit (pyruvate/2-ketoisovalerate family)/2-oxoacid:acceptor oxidoreductase delta subunit (pyruvate/2-ketoisovalerate family)
MLIVGRGGEGVVLASQVLADAFARAGFYVQSFPEFKAERRGAPISAFLRFDDEPIHRRYKVRDCDVLVVVTPSLPSPLLLGRVRQGGLVLLNREHRLPEVAPFHFARVPASRIAQRRGILSSEGRPMGNIALLGACVRLLLPEGIEFLVEAIEARLGASAAANVEAAREGYERCTAQHAFYGDERFAPVAPPPPQSRWPLYPVSTLDAVATQTGSWSLDRPVLLDACTACGLCAVFCPEGAITRADGEMAIDYLHCKGCGICEVVCPVRDAVAMEAVPA